MARPYFGRRTGKRGRAIRCRRAAEMTAERAREHLVAAESRGERDVDIESSLASSRAAAPFETQTQGVPLRRLAHHAPERPMQVERRPAGARRQRVERHVRVQTMTNGTQQLQQIALGGHQSRMIDEVRPGLLDVSCGGYATPNYVMALLSVVLPFTLTTTRTSDRSPSTQTIRGRLISETAQHVSPIGIRHRRRRDEAQTTETVQLDANVRERTAPAIDYLVDNSRDDWRPRQSPRRCVPSAPFATM